MWQRMHHVWLGHTCGPATYELRHAPPSARRAHRAPAPRLVSGGYVCWVSASPPCADADFGGTVAVVGRQPNGHATVS
jgi:hypothetical protein